ncbi:MAG: hypothetical protein AAB152_08395 [Candidatus Coatesbacteria bacterium]
MNNPHPQDGESGQGLAYVLIISAVLLVFLVALVDVLTRESKWIVRQAKGLDLLHAADAAIDRGLYALQRGGNWDGIPSGSVIGYDQNKVYSDSPGMLYTIKIQEGNWTPGYMMGDKASERTITAFVTYTPTGEHKKVQAVVIKSTLNSALFSGGGIQVKGSADINWGPVVSYASGPNTIVDPANADDHPVYMSRGGIVAKGLTPCLGDGIPTVGVCYLEYASVESLGTTPFVDLDQLRFEADQQKTLVNPTTLGKACVDVGPAGGPMPGTAGAESVIFYDTCDGKNYYPPPTGSNLCKGACTAINNGADVKFTGGCGQGKLIVLGDLTTAGNGSCEDGVLLPPPADCNKYDKDGDTCPPYNVYTNNEFWDGFIYVAGNLNSNGVKMIYGTIYANNSAGVSGTFKIFYKPDNNALASLGKTCFIELWMERAPKAGDVFPVSLP